MRNRNDKNQINITNVNVFLLLFILFIATIIISIFSIGQYLWFKRADIAHENFFSVRFFEKDPETKKILKNIDYNKDMCPALHFIPPFIAYLLSLITVFIIKQVYKNKLRKRYSLFPNLNIGIFLISIYTLVSVTSLIISGTKSYSKMQFGAIPAFYDVMLATIVAIIISSNEWIYFKNIFNQIFEKGKNEVFQFRNYIQSILKIVNRSTIFLLVSISFGFYKVLDIYKLHGTLGYEYHILEIAFGFLLCAFFIIKWIIYPIYIIHEQADIEYFYNQKNNNRR